MTAAGCRHIPLYVILTASLAWFVPALATDEETAADCAICHDDVAATHRFHAQDAAATEPAYGLDCSDCHEPHDLDDPPSTPGLTGSKLIELCAACHDDETEHFRKSEHGKSVVNGVEDAPDCLVCHDQPITPARELSNGADLKIAQEQVCLACHLDDPVVRAKMVPTAGFIAAYESSVHGAALMMGREAAANCVDCHGSHDMMHGSDPQARVSRSAIPGTCGACHDEIAREYSASVHGAMMRKGNHDAPVCTSCHGEHDIMDPADPRSPVAPANVSAQVCSPCHSSLRLSEKYGIASDRFQTFSDSYHGMAIRGGQVEVANCASCHGSHDILPSADPQSSVHRASLEATCGKCHPGANQRFADGAVHIVLTEPGERVLYWVATLYLGLIVAVIGGMFAHNLLDFTRRAGRILRARHLGHDVGETHSGHALHVRMSLGERIQHGTLMMSFLLLVVTGFMLHYPDAWWVRALQRLSDDLFALRSRLHRVAGVVMIGASLYHLVYLAYAARGRQFLRDMLPRRADLMQTLRSIAYNLRLTASRPRFDRFGYVEKLEYWALLWGTMVMAVTGVILWFENTFIGLLTKLGWDVARTVHFYEAWLATLAILVWHIYYVVFNPDVYPMNTTWLTGTITEAEMEEEHPLELERIRRRRLEETTRRTKAEEPASK